MSDMIEVDTTDMRTTASPAVKDKWETWCDPNHELLGTAQ